MSWICKFAILPITFNRTHVLLFFFLIQLLINLTLDLTAQGGRHSISVIMRLLPLKVLSSSPRVFMPGIQPSRGSPKPFSLKSLPFCGIRNFNTVWYNSPHRERNGLRKLHYKWGSVESCVKEELFLHVTWMAKYQSTQVYCGKFCIYNI